MTRPESAVNLNRQLEAYAAVAKLPEHHARSRWAKWPIYAAATGAALAGASAASAEIIYSGPQNLSATLPFAFGTVSTGVQVDVDGKHDIFDLHARNFDVPMLGFGNFAGEVNAGFANSRGTRSGGIFTIGAGSAKNFAPGARISGTHGLNRGALLFSNFLFRKTRPCTKTSCTFFSRFYPSSGRRGRFTAGRSGFLGLEFNGKTASGKPGPREYGWVRVVFAGSTRGTPIIFPTSITIVDWAYNTDGPILAGQTSSPVPEPSTMPITLLAAGAAGVLAWKRRKQQ